MTVRPSGLPVGDCGGAVSEERVDDTGREVVVVHVERRVDLAADHQGEASGIRHCPGGHGVEPVEPSVASHSDHIGAAAIDAEAQVLDEHGREAREHEAGARYDAQVVDILRAEPERSQAALDCVPPHLQGALPLLGEELSHRLPRDSVCVRLGQDQVPGADMRCAEHRSHPCVRHTVHLQDFFLGVPGRRVGGADTEDAGGLHARSLPRVPGRAPSRRQKHPDALHAKLLPRP